MAPPFEVELLLPAAVRAACGGATSVALVAADVTALLAAFAQRWPEAYRMVCDEQGALRPHLSLFLNDELVRPRASPAARLRAGDRVTILPAVSGG